MQNRTIFFQVNHKNEIEAQRSEGITACQAKM